jgi:hypothetical protein
VGLETNTFQDNNEQAKDGYRALQVLSIVTLLVGIAIAAGVGYIVHSVHRTLKTAATKLSAGAEMVVAAAGQMSNASQSLSQSATEQAASLEETSASVEELAQMTRLNADATSQVVGHLAEVDARRERVEPGAARHGHRHGRHSGVEPPGVEDHQDDRRDRIPDEHPRAERGGRGRARRRGGHGLRRRRRRSPELGAPFGAGGAGHDGPDLAVNRPRRAGRTRSSG